MQVRNLLHHIKELRLSKHRGDNLTEIQGEGYNFNLLREYASGDDIRHIDWLTTAKVSKPYVKLFTQERELHITIVPLLSGSLYFGTEVLKKDFVTKICKLLTYSCIENRDALSTFIGSDTLLKYTSQTKQVVEIKNFINAVENFQVLGKILNYPALEEQLFEALKQRATLIIIGDFFEANLLSLVALSSKHSLILIIVRDRFEQNPQAIGELNIQDPQTQEYSQALIDTQSVQNHKKRVTENDALLEQKLYDLRIPFLKIYTDEVLEA